MASTRADREVAVTEGGARTHVHLITPGDHFSPRTGSAIPTVVHGLARATPARESRPAVLVSRGTYPDRYDSAEVVEYDGRHRLRSDRVADLAAGRFGLPRPGERRVLAAAIAPLRDRPASLVLAHNAPQAVPLVPAGHAAVLYAHNRLFRTYGRRELHRVLARAERIICVSTYLAEDTARALPPGLRHRLRVVHNGVDTTLFAVPRPARGAHLRVTFLGRTVPDKGAHVLLEALHLLGRTDIAVTIVGRPGFSAEASLTSYERQLHRRAAQVQPRPRFASFRPRPELPQLLAATDVLVVPSVWPEPFGLTALEGMAAGAAVVASAVGGLPEAVGEGAVLVPPGDASALADVLLTLAEDPAALSSWQSAARRRAAQRDWSLARGELVTALADVG